MYYMIPSLWLNNKNYYLNLQQEKNGFNKFLCNSQQCILQIKKIGIAHI